jgi:hypothetical protein
MASLRALIYFDSEINQLVLSSTARSRYKCASSAPPGASCSSLILPSERCMSRRLPQVITRGFRDSCVPHCGPAGSCRCRCTTRSSSTSSLLKCTFCCGEPHAVPTFRESRSFNPCLHEVLRVPDCVFKSDRDKSFVNYKSMEDAALMVVHDDTVRLLPESQCLQVCLIIMRRVLSCPVLLNRALLCQVLSRLCPVL